MNATPERTTDTRTLRIAAIAATAVIVLAVAAYFFGSELRADTTASVAPSPIGSSLTAVRASMSEDFVDRLARSSAAVSSASVGLSTADYASLGHPASANKSSASAADYASLGLSVFAAAGFTSTGIATADYASFGLPVLAIEGRGPSSADKAAELKLLEESWAPFHAGLDKALRDAGER